MALGGGGLFLMSEVPLQPKVRKSSGDFELSGVPTKKGRVLAGTSLPILTSSGESLDWFRSILLSSLELSDTKVDKLQIRALLGTASKF